MFEAWLPSSHGEPSQNAPQGRAYLCRLYAGVNEVTSEEMAVISKVQLFCMVLVTFLAVYLNYPAPGFSKKLQEWRDTGKYFNYKGNAIFYQGDGPAGEKVT